MKKSGFILIVWTVLLAVCFAPAAYASENNELFHDRKDDSQEETNEPDDGQDEGGGPAGSGRGTGIFHRKPEPAQSSGGQLTADDIERMNDGNVTMLFSDEGYLTFLRGRYYDGLIEDHEDGIVSLEKVQALLGLSKGSEFYCIFGEKDRQGYTIYTYQQRYGETTLQNAVLKIIVDPEGKAAGLMSSFTPNIGIAPENEDAVTPEEAENIVEDNFPDLQFTFYPENTAQTSMTFDTVAYHCWAVFTDVPAGFGTSGERRYLEHLVAYDGTYMGYLAVTSPKELVKGDNMQPEVALSWFDGYEPGEYTGTVMFQDGSEQEITVPVLRDPDGRYYLGDLDRHILVADYASREYGDTIRPLASEDNTSWPNEYLITYYNYIRVYDFYDSYGMTSVDGFGIPILILTDACDASGAPIDNAFFHGYDRGWALFGASDVNYYGECIDVIGHEYTHGITTYSFAGDLYQNETGAVNEALSDVMGNLCEMLLGATEDDTWLIAENTGSALRSMSFPWIYGQPTTVGGKYYQSTAGKPNMYNDLGGVHTNSSLVNYIAWQLWDRGMSLEDEFRLWREAISLLTPLSGFREVHHALVFAAVMLDMEPEWMATIDMLCEQAGY